MATIEKRVNDDGSIGYRAKVRIKGFPPQSATFKRLTDARNWAGQIEVDMKSGSFRKTEATRRDEIRTMMWKDVLLDKGKIILPKTKNKKQRTIHLSHYALAEIEKRYQEHKQGDVYVFPSPHDQKRPIDFRRAWRTAIKNSEIKDFRFHDLRHRGEKLKDKAQKAMRTLGGFAQALKVKYADIEVGLDLGREQGVADSGDLEVDLIDLLVMVGESAQENKTAVILSIDELQYVPEEQLAALITAFHRVSQMQLPITLIAAGLPQLLGQMGRAKSYAERLFEFSPVDKLDDTAAKEALCKPAEKEAASFTNDAIKQILKQTQGYPYFLQEWGKHSWLIAAGPKISLKDAEGATVLALAELDQSFFRVRFDRLTPSEKKYVRAMAELGPGPHRSGDIAEKLDKLVSTVAPTRSSLIKKGMIYSPTHGDTAFTVPLFDGFMKRSIPNL